MSGGWPIGMELCSADNKGAVTSTSRPTTMTSSGSANTKGSWVQLDADTTVDYVWLLVQLYASTGASGGTVSVDIGIGASGSQIVIAPDLVASQSSSTSGPAVSTYFFPCSIPAGSSVWVRAQATTTTQTVYAQVTGFDASFSNMEGAGGIDVLGFSSGSTLGTTITASGSTNTKGSYSELVAATSRDYMGFFIGTTGASATTKHHLLDIAIGAAGSEVVILSNLYILTTAMWSAVPTFFLPINIPAGTRISARVQSATASSAFGLTLYGVYQ
jgi:hypothetical protein